MSAWQDGGLLTIAPVCLFDRGYWKLKSAGSPCCENSECSVINSTSAFQIRLSHFGL